MPRSFPLLGRALAALALSLPASQAADDPLVYVALGDSYTAGPFVPLPTGDPIDCGQSTQNYPHLVARALGADVFRDVSCGSATIDDFAAPQDGLPAGGTNPPQFDALEKGVDVVTVGIGGNDVGFVGAALDCMRAAGPPVQQPCSEDLRAGGRDRLSEKIQDTAPELAAALETIHGLAPGAKVFLVGYPTALPDNGVACWPYVPILQADMPYLVAKFKEMNAMLATMAAEHGATYVDIYTSSIGHDACQLPPNAWVNGIVTVPVSLFAHPNELSFRHSAPLIASAIREGRSRGRSVVSFR